MAEHSNASRKLSLQTQNSITDSVKEKQDVDRSPSLDTSIKSEEEQQQQQQQQQQEQDQEGPRHVDPSSFPDGGLQAWSVVAGGFLLVFCSFGWINCIGVFQDYYQFHQLKTYSSSAVAWIPSTESFMLFFWGLVAGKAVDDYGPRLPVTFGSFLHVFGLMMTSISHNYYQIFLAQAVCSAIGCSFLFYASVAAVGTWFLRHRALAMGVMVSGSSIGGVVLPIMVNKLIPQIGFGWTIRAVAFTMLALLAIGNVLIKSRIPPTGRKIGVKDFIDPFKEPAFVLLTVGFLFVYFGAFLPFTFIIVQAKHQGMPAELANYLVPIINAASTFGRIIPLQLGDMYGVFNVMIGFTLFGGVLSLALWIPGSSSAALIVFAVLYGFASGCFLSIAPTLVAKISDIRKLGTRVGIMYALASFGVLTGSPIGGAISSSQDGSFSGLKIFCGVTLLAGAMCVLLSRWWQVGWKILVKI